MWNHTHDIQYISCMLIIKSFLMVIISAPLQIACQGQWNSMPNLYRNRPRTYVIGLYIVLCWVYGLNEVMNWDVSSSWSRDRLSKNIIFVITNMNLSYSTRLMIYISVFVLYFGYSNTVTYLVAGSIYWLRILSSLHL